MTLHGMGYFPQRIAAVISLMELSDPFGGTLGLTIMTTVFNNVAGLGGDSSPSDFTSLSHMEPDELDMITQNAKVIGTGFHQAVNDQTADGFRTGGHSLGFRSHLSFHDTCECSEG